MTRPDKRQEGYLPLLMRAQIERELRNRVMPRDLAVLVFGNTYSVAQVVNQLADEWKRLLGERGFRWGCSCSPARASGLTDCPSSKTRLSRRRMTRQAASPKWRHSRPPLERMLRIHQAVQSGSFPNSTQLAAELEVSTKSIHRDIDFMRDRLELPIEFNSHQNGYHYTAEVTAFPTLHITEGELVALVIAEKALEQYRGTQFEKPLLSAIRKIEQSLPDTISLNLADIEQTISFRTRAEPVLELKTFDALAKATAHRKQLELIYRKTGSAQSEARLVDPYHLANINGEWYLFAYDHARKDIRTFVPARVQAVKQTGKTFPSPKRFSLEQRLRGSFGVHSGEGEFEVVLRFNSRVAGLIREKKWHESQQLRELKDGGVELNLKLSSLVEIERWVLSWGGDAMVLKPRELADAVKLAANRILAANR